MRACIQRVKHASVVLPKNGSNTTVAEIGNGSLILLGVGVNDTEAEAVLLANKCAELRIFEDGLGKMNRSIHDANGSMLVVSQFTLFADCKHGRRPSFTGAAPPEKAEQLYCLFVDEIKKRNIPVSTGVFRAEMLVELVNDGPVTIWMDTETW